MTRWELSGLSVWLRLLFRMNLIKTVQVDEGQSSVRGASFIQYRALRCKHLILRACY